MERKIYYYMNQLKDLMDGKYVNPVTCEIDPSNLCQLDCSFCIYKGFRRQDAVFLDIDKYNELIVNLSMIGVKSVTFTGGGEPLMHPDFNKMAETAWAKGIETGLITNGVNLGKVENKDAYTFIRVSLDAYDRESYQRVKGMDLFDQVVGNIWSATEKTTVGISYVVCNENADGLKQAANLAESLGAAYIQFKPMVMPDGTLFSDYKLPNGELTIKTDRYKALNMLPCIVAHLIGIVTANGDVYYCCQHRGHDAMRVGNIYERPFDDIWKTRTKIVPDISHCVHCRYMGYARVYEETIKDTSFIFKHRNFL